ncbi:FliM/FliN family flagellar motor switch protein [Solimicrobium silvestre]|uniref:Flagellar motor switch protein FliN n=1 Tax=Solimicrobium silvestre TaxID=2099400 RepID=A0A2S9H1R9_9BURK|nr:FliM/FliN family flagellar motor switch protein [Solimicrobium silvestre]PRC93919.1 Surface presentation of antigens (SPOA) [Solimicrobium silvestre]
MKNSETEIIQLNPQMIELSEIAPHHGKGPAIISDSLDAIEHVKVRLVVQVGEASITVGELHAMKEEHVIKLESLADAPVDILLEGRVVARGQLVAVDDNFGVRITELPKARL